MPRRPTVTRRRLALPGLALSLILAGCDVLQSTVPPPPPSKEEREALRRKAALESGAVPIETVSTQPLVDQPAEHTTPADPAHPVPSPASTSSPKEGRPITPHTAWTLEETAADALGRIGPAAVPSLILCLNDERPESRRRAAEVLARIGPDAAAAVPALTTLLKDPDPSVRRASARALGQIGPAAGTAVPELLDLFNERPAP